MGAKVRLARPSDKVPLMSFIRDVWGGHDYVPRVWDRWLRDPRRTMFVVELDGTPVGMNRVKFLEDGSAWFEGARVHPDHRREGLATLMGEYSTKEAARRGASVFRLTSGSRNRIAHMQIAKIKFEEASRFSIYEPPEGRVAEGGSALRVKPGEAEAALRLMEGTSEFKLGGGVFWHEFTAASLSPEVVGRLVASGEVWRNGRAVAVRRVGGEGSGVWEQVCFIGGPPDEALELVGGLPGRRKKTTARWVFVPKGSPIITALRKEGFTRHFSLVLFERKPVNG
jgi:GNAT superfamily N-acetyltransferase